MGGFFLFHRSLPHSSVIRSSFRGLHCSQRGTGRKRKELQAYSPCHVSHRFISSALPGEDRASECPDGDHFSPRNEKLMRLFLDCTSLSAPEMVPNLKLRLITPESSLWFYSEDQWKAFSGIEDGDALPYWGFAWPGGQTLARYLLDNPKVVNRRSVLDIGSGCGIAAIAAKLAGAKRVVANDIDPIACLSSAWNDNLNPLKITINDLENRCHKPTKQKRPTMSSTLHASTHNYLAHPDPAALAQEFDTVIVADMFYEEELAAIQTELFLEATSRGVRVLVGDPGRQFLPTKHLRQVATYPYPKELQASHYGFVEGSVWEFVA